MDAKRSFDVVVSLGAIVSLWPLAVGVAIVVFVVLGSPILFIQSRPGLHGKPFNLVKFRTMSESSGKYDEVHTDEERLTSVGRFLRASSLDELPEFWNILRGDMSVVGPRPLLMEYLPLYSLEQNRRHDVRPGLTGWAQVNGRNAISWDERFALDLWYVDHRTLWLDVQILVRTISKVLVRDGISAPGRATMEKFRGETGE